MTPKRAIHIYTVAFSMKKLPKNERTYHVHNVVAETKDLAEANIRDMFNVEKINTIEYNCTAIETV